MKNIFTMPLIVLLLAVSGSGSELRAGDAEDRRGTSDRSQTISIVTTIRPLELIVRDLLGDDADERFTVTSLLSPSVSPHGFEPTARQIAQLHRADIVIYNGAGLDDWAGRNLPSNVKAIRFAEVVGRSHHHHASDDGHHACCAHGHHRGSDDEHFWMDAELVEQLAAACRETVGELTRARFVDAGDVLVRLDRRLEEFLAQVQEVDEAFADSLKPLRDRRIVTHHNVFSRIAARYGLGDPLVLRPLAAVEPTPRDLRRSIRTIRAERIAAILIEPQFSAAAAERIRDETNVRLISVDPLGGEAASWPELMHEIRVAITQCFDQP